jgi:polysaccharide deacetylase family sporulation protein PdaB
MFSFLMIIVTVLLAVNINGSVMASVFFGKVDRKLPIYSVSTEEKKVAISFDAAWGADKTEGILELLEEYDVQATFFLVGFWVEEYPDKVKAIDEKGHEIGTHSNTHPDMALLDEQAVKDELSLSMEKITKVTGKEVKLFRPPYGSYNDNLITVADNLGLKTIQWDTDSLDWKGLSATNIANRVVQKVKNGSIILMHNNSDNILPALRLILSQLSQKGYEITSIGNLIYETNYTIDHQGVQQPV